MRYQRDLGPYPPRLRELPDPPAVLTTTGPLEPRARRVVAIVGSREPTEEARIFARALAAALARRGVIVVSGGAVGIDAAAHRGALDGGGETWAVLPTGRLHPFPRENVRLFQALTLAPGSRLVWPVPADCKSGLMKYRNGILCALADAVVVVQAHFRSGSLNAANWARQLRRPLWMVPAHPWDGLYSGALPLLATGEARALWSLEGFIAALDRAEAGAKDDLEGFWGARPGALPYPRTLPRSTAEQKPRPSRRRLTAQTGVLPGLRSPAEITILSVLSGAPRHVDEIASRACLGASATVTALLTLALEDVVVEGPDGFFRLQNAE